MVADLANRGYFPEAGISQSYSPRQGSVTTPVCSDPCCALADRPPSLRMTQTPAPLPGSDNWTWQPRAASGSPIASRPQLGVLPSGQAGRRTVAMARTARWQTSAREAERLRRPVLSTGPRPDVAPSRNPAVGTGRSFVTRKDAGRCSHDPAGASTAGAHIVWPASGTGPGLGLDNVVSGCESSPIRDVTLAKNG